MQRPGLLLLALVFFGMATIQYLAAVGRIEVDQWPFVRSKNRGARFAFAAWAGFLGVAVLVWSFV